MPCTISQDTDVEIALATSQIKASCLCELDLMISRVADAAVRAKMQRLRVAASKQIDADASAEARRLVTATTGCARSAAQPRVSHGQHARRRVRRARASKRTRPSQSRPSSTSHTDGDPPRRAQTTQDSGAGDRS